ncbi:MAG: phage integrase N-terminal SAM-like domain-containing protein [Limnohabitans sp.]
MKSGAPYWQSIRLLDQVQCLHYSLEANKNYLYWIRFLSNGVQCNPVACTIHSEMGVADVKAFFSMLAKARKVSVGDARNPLNALAAHV